MSKVTQDQVIEVARSGLGVPYVWGGNTRKGWDCSGFVLYCLRTSGAVPKEFPDTNADGIYKWAVKNGKRISVEEAFNMGCALIYRVSRIGSMEHVGFATRGGVVEARGKKYGTVERDNPGTFTHATTIPGVI